MNSIGNSPLEDCYAFALSVYLENKRLMEEIEDSKEDLDIASEPITKRR